MIKIASDGLPRLHSVYKSSPVNKAQSVFYGVLHWNYILVPPYQCRYAGSKTE